MGLMTSHTDHEPNGESSIPTWVYMTGVGLFIFTIFCFCVMLAGMVFI